MRERKTEKKEVAKMINKNNFHILDNDKRVDGKEAVVIARNYIDEQESIIKRYDYNKNRDIKSEFDKNAQTLTITKKNNFSESVWNELKEKILNLLDDAIIQQVLEDEEVVQEFTHGVINGMYGKGIPSPEFDLGR